MRDPDRIDPFIEIIRDTWKMHSDWRLGQLIVNSLYWLNGPCDCRGQCDCFDPFYVEDDKLIEAIQKLNDAPIPSISQA